MSEIIYKAWDREEKLGPPPWDPKDPKVVAWEAAHCHDVRQKCYVEFGCYLAFNELEASARALIKCSEEGGLIRLSWFRPHIDRLRDALEAL